MNEMTEVRSLREDCPAPGNGRLASQRALLVKAAQDEGGRRRKASAARTVLVGGFPRHRVLLFTAAATTLAVTAGVVATFLEGSTTRDPHVLSAQASADALELAAATVENSGVTAEPGPKQWLYVKSMDFNQGKPYTEESWQRWDGTADAVLPRRVYRPGKPLTLDWTLKINYATKEQVKKAAESDPDSRSQPQFFRFLNSLPRDPDAMMRRIRQEHAIGDVKGETKAERDWRELNVLYRSVLIPSKVQAAMFRVLAKNTDARVEKGVKDPAGRTAIGVFVNYTKRTAAGWQGRQELFFDPKTYAYLGESLGSGQQLSNGNAIRSDDPQSVPSAVKGKIHSAGMASARVAWGVVNKPGERPQG
jgi:hypothetical protein